MPRDDHLLGALSRRGFGAGLCGVLLTPPRVQAAAALPGEITARVLRGGHHIGEAVYHFSQDGDDLRVAISVDLRIGFGFVTVYRYVHANQERWRAGRLTSFDARTNKNGAMNYATARADEAGVHVEGSATAPYIASLDAVGTSYWSPRTLVAPLIDTENGRKLRIEVAPLGPNPAILASGATVGANEYAMTGDMHINIWFDSDGVWQGMQYFAHDGSMIVYEKA